MTTKDDILRILKEEMPRLKERHGISKIGLFGSYSRGEQDAESDIDLLVQIERPIVFFQICGHRGISKGEARSKG